MSNKRILILSMVIVCAFAFGLVCLADDAGAEDGEGTANVDYTWVFAGQNAGEDGNQHFSFTYVPDEDFTSNDDPGIKLTIPEVTGYVDWNHLTHPWTKPQTSTSGADGYVWVTDGLGNAWAGAVITFEDGDGHATGVVDRKIVVKFSSRLPTTSDTVVIHYDGVAQRHAEWDVYFKMESDEDGDGTYVEIDASSHENPNIDVLPSAAYKLVMTILPDQTFDPNPYLEPTVWHDTDIIADKTVGVPFDVELRLVDIYGNPVIDHDFTYAYGTHNVRIRGAGISPCYYVPEMTVWNGAANQMSDNPLEWWYVDQYGVPNSANQDDLPENFYAGQVRWISGYSGFDPVYTNKAPMVLYKVENNIRLYDKIYNDPVSKYEYQTPPFDVVSITGSVDKNYGTPVLPMPGSDPATHRITKNTPIILTSNDLNNGIEDIAYIQWKISWGWNGLVYQYNTDWQPDPYTTGDLGKSPVQLVLADLESTYPGISDDCRHRIDYRVKDKFCNDAGAADWQEFYVDSTAPDTTDIKVIGTPKWDDGTQGAIIWVTKNTLFSFNIDPDPDLPEGVCQSGLDYIMYRIYIDGQTPPTQWERYEGGTFTIPEDCDHWLEWYGVDKLGNTEDPYNRQRHYVDTTPPESEWHWIDSGQEEIMHQDGTGHPDGYWIDRGDAIYLTCEDKGCDPDDDPNNGEGVGTDETWWRYEWTDGTTTTYYPGPAATDFELYLGQDISWNRDCKHTIFFYNVDRLGNVETPVNSVSFWVDGTAPVSEWHWSAGTSYTPTVHYDDAGAPDGYWVGNTIDHAVWIECNDAGCDGGVGTDKTYWRYEWTDGTTTEYYPGPGPNNYALYEGQDIWWPRDCKHTIYFYNVDYLGNVETPVNSVSFWVDGTTPISRWGFDGPGGGITYGDQIDVDTSDPLDGVPDYWWIDYDTEIWIECDDFGCDDGVGVQYTLWRYEWESVSYPIDDTGLNPGDVKIGDVWYWIYDGTIWWEDDCVHYLYFLNVDWLDNMEEEWCLEFWVDGSRPISGWEFGGPTTGETYGDQIPDDPDYWIDYDTEIWLWCEDYGCEGGSGDYYDYPTYWFFEYYPDNGPIETRPRDGSDTEYGTPVLYFGEWYWVYSDNFPIIFDEDCGHWLWWFNVDPLGNEELIWNDQWFWVDGTPPQSSAGVLSGDSEYDSAGDFTWVDHETVIEIVCEDWGCLDGVGWYYDYWTYWGFNYDDLQGGSPVWRPTDITDDEYGTPVRYGGIWFWRTTGMGQIITTFSFNEDCIHELVYFNVDSLGNREEPKSMTFKVDGTAPVSDWYWSASGYNPIVHTGAAGPDGYWVGNTVEHAVWIDCNDAGCDGGIGTEETWWRYEWVDVQGVTHYYPGPDATDFELYQGQDIWWLYDCKHTIYFYNVDLLGNVETPVKSVSFWVDGTKPVSGWDWADQNYEPIEHLDVNGDPDGYWIGHGDAHTIFLYCDDYGCPTEYPVVGGVGTDETYWRYEWTDVNGDTWYWPNQNDPTEFALYDERPIYWNDDCKHTIYFYNVDRLGNVELVQSVSFWVDGTAPKSGWNWGPAGHNTYQPFSGGYRINYDTWIELTCIDYGCPSPPGTPGGVGGTKTYYRWVYTAAGGSPMPYPTPTDSWDYMSKYDDSLWMEYTTTPLSWSSDCMRELWVINVDALGNEEIVTGPALTLYVDGTKPVSDWNFVTGSGNWYEHVDSDPTLHDEWWITPGTDIALTCDDYGCPAEDGQIGPGSTTTYYRWEWYDEDMNLMGVYPATGYEEYTVPIFWLEDCYHILYYYNVDDLGNEELVNVAYFHVDGTPPEPSIDYSQMDPTGYYDPNDDLDDNPSTGGTYIKTGVPIYLTADDGDGICDSGIPDCGIRYRIWYDNAWHPDADDDHYAGNPGGLSNPVLIIEWNSVFWYHYEGPFTFEEECEHKIVLDAMDRLENHWDPDFFVYASKPTNANVHGATGWYIDDWNGQVYAAGTDDIAYLWDVSIPSGEDANMHPSNPEALGPMSVRTFSTPITYDMSVDGVDADHRNAFCVDATHIYYGGRGPIHKWNRNVDGTFGTYIGIVAPGHNPVGFETNGETLAFDGTKFYTGARASRDIYSITPGDSAWAYEFTATIFSGGAHHDGLAFFGGYLWVSDMTVDNIEQWEEVSPGFWVLQDTFTYTSGSDVEGMGMGPFNHMWITSGFTLYEIGGGRLQHAFEGKAIQFWVEDMYPYIEKTVGDCNQFEDRSQYLEAWWVSQSTPITIDTWDLGCPTVYSGPDDHTPGGSGLSAYYYIILRYDGTNWVFAGGEDLSVTGVPRTFYFQEDCMHKLIITSIDNLGHRTVDEELFLVDSLAPTTSMTVDDAEGKSGPCDPTFWITGATDITLTTVDDGCLGGIGNNGYNNYIFFEIWFDGYWYGPFSYTGPFTLDSLDPVYRHDDPNQERPIYLGDDCDHEIRYWAVDEICNTEDKTIKAFKVSNVAPIPTITNPVFDWYYRPGYIMDLLWSEDETTGGDIIAEAWFYSFDGTTWYPIVDSNPNKPGVQWDTSVIPDLLCDEETRKMVHVKVILYDEHCRDGYDTEQVWFCRENNPQPCTQNIPIRLGWNLISIAVDLDSLGLTEAEGGYTASVLAAEINSQAGENIVKYVVRWNSGTNKFNEYVVDSDIGHDFPIEKGEGYYVYSLSPFESIFTIVGDCAECEVIDLKVCWNLVGWDSMGSMTVGAFVNLINTAHGPPEVVLAVVRYVTDPMDPWYITNLGPGYQAWYPGYSDTLFNLETNNAYWVFVAQEVNGIPLP